MFALSRSTAATALSVLAASAFLLSSPQAHAASDDWASRSSPLRAIDDDIAQALAYGTAYTKLSYLKNHTFYRDPRAGGDPVYTETTYSYYKWCNGIQLGWCDERGKDQSARDESGDWVDQYDADDYSEQGAEKGRVHYKVCEDHNNAPDVCSRKPYSTFSGL